MITTLIRQIKYNMCTVYECMLNVLYMKIWAMKLMCFTHQHSTILDSEIAITCFYPCSELGDLGGEKGAYSSSSST